MAQFGSVSSAFSKQGDSLLMVVAEAPVDATVEPTLGIRRGGCHLSGVGSEIIRIVHVAPRISDELIASADRCRQQGVTYRDGASSLRVHLIYAGTTEIRKELVAQTPQL